MINLADLVRLVNQGGATAILVVTVFVLGIGASRGWWYAGRWVDTLISEHERVYKQMTEERDAWRTVALSYGGTAHKAVELAEAQVGLKK